MSDSRPLQVQIRPPWPYRLSGRGRGDSVLRARGGVVWRSVRVGDADVVVRAGQGRDGTVVIRAEAVGDPVGDDVLEVALERMRFALAVDEDLTAFYDEFRLDPLLGPAIRAKPWIRPRRRPWPWEALAWAITEQLIEASRAAQIQRRIVWRHGREIPFEAGEKPLREVPPPQLIAGLAPAELQAMDLSAARSIAMIHAAREIATGRIDPADPAHDRRLLAISEIGPWTVQCLGLHGRGDPDSLPAGDLNYVKLVGFLAGLGRRATVEEVEEFFAPYAPYRGLAGGFILAHTHKQMGVGPPLRAAA